MLSHKTSRTFSNRFEATIIALIVCDKRDRAFDTMLNLSNLYLSSRLKNNKYKETRIRRRLSLSILILLRIIYLKIDIVVE